MYLLQRHGFFAAAEAWLGRHLDWLPMIKPQALGIILRHLAQILTPPLDRLFSVHSIGYRKGRSREDAVEGIRAALADANPGIPESAIGVKLSPRGWLEEIRLCYAKTFRPTRCNAARFGAKDAAPAKIWRGL